MTHDEILALPADRLVAEVATRVMGWHPTCLTAFGGRWWVRHPNSSNADWLPLKDTDDLAMVHERIRELGKQRIFIANLMANIQSDCITEGNTLHFLSHTASPLDHLRAALLAVQENEA